MMIGIIITLIAIALVAFFGLKLLKSIIIFKAVFKIISLVFALLFIVLIISSYYIIKDANDFRKNFANENNLFVLVDSKTLDVISAFELENKTYSIAEDIVYINNSFNKYEFSNMNDDYYKIVLIKTDALDYINDIEITELDTKLNGQELKKILENNSSIEEIKKILDNEKKYAKIADMEMTDSQLKDYLFSYVITETFNPKNINILLSNIKSDNILIYENTAFFKSIKFVPNILIKDLTKTDDKIIFSKDNNNTEK